MIKKRNSLVEYKKTLKLTLFQRQVLVGLLLGDGCLETQNKGRTYRLLIEQSEQHTIYCDHLYSIFRSWVLTPPKISIRKNGQKSQKFKTVSHSSFRFYGQQFYDSIHPPRRKKLPKLIHRWLNPCVLAYWFMDDGSFKSSQSYGILLNTQNFQLSEIRTLCQIMTERWNLKCSPRKQKNQIYKRVYYQIYISGRSFYAFLKLIDPYLIDSMRYKLPPPFLKKDNNIA